MLHRQYPNRIEVTHPDGPHRDQTVELPLMFATAKRRINQRYRPSFAGLVEKGCTVRVILADEVSETFAPPAHPLMPHVAVETA